MASRQFSITIPADANFHNLYAMMLAVAGAIPTDGILADRVCNINILANTGNIYIADNNFANNVGDFVAQSDNWNKSFDRNCICLRDYWIQGNGVNFSVDVVSV